MAGAAEYVGDLFLGESWEKLSSGNGRCVCGRVTVGDVAHENDLGGGSCRHVGGSAAGAGSGYMGSRREAMSRRVYSSTGRRVGASLSRPSESARVYHGATVQVTATAPLAFTGDDRKLALQVTDPQDSPIRQDLARAMPGTESVDECLPKWNGKERRELVQRMLELCIPELLEPHFKSPGPAQRRSP